jgi:hypothetical protein
MSKQERASWSLLVINLIIGVVYFSKVFASGVDWRLQMAATSRAFVQVTILAIVLAIVAEIVMNVLNGKDQDRVAADERDHLIMLKSRRNGHFVLVTALIVLMGTLVVASGFTLGDARHAIDAAGAAFSRAGAAILMANLLLLALVLTEIAMLASCVFYYRRGY